MSTAENIVHYHREISIRFVAESEALVVRTPRGQKDPGHIGWDPKSNSRQRSLENLAILRNNDDNVGVHLFGPIVDVDIDSDNPLLVAALDHFLPHTAHVYGRKSRPRTHRLYELSDATFDPRVYRFLTAIKANDNLAVEIRGGEMKSGQYSLLPGSLHPSEEYYEWENPKAIISATLVRTDPIRIVEGVRYACVAATIAPYWVEGQRNDMCKALCGFLYHVHKMAPEVDAETLFERSDAERILEGVMLIAEDDPADRNMRIRTLAQTWDKGDAGAPLVGATRIQEITGDPGIKSLLYTLLMDSPELQALDDALARYATRVNSTEIIDLQAPPSVNMVMNREAFAATLEGEYITLANGKKAQISQMVMRSKQRLKIQKIAFDPTKERVFTDEKGLTAANTWRGWGIAPHDQPVSDDEPCVAAFKDYVLTVLANGDLLLGQHILDWVCFRFQYPSVKPTTALVLVGKQGTGKSFLPLKVMAPIIGSEHSTKVSTAEKLVSKFNVHTGSKLLITGEEVMKGTRKADADALKDAITAETRMVEPKGVDPYSINDCAMHIFTSNHVNAAVYVEPGDRRYTIAKVSDRYTPMMTGNTLTPHEYWMSMHPLFEVVEAGRKLPHEENLAKLHRWFLDQKIDPNVGNTVYETDVKRATRMESSSGLAAFFQSIIYLNNPFDRMDERIRGFDHSYRKDRKSGKLVKTNDWPEYVSFNTLSDLYNKLSADKFNRKNAQVLLREFRTEDLIPTEPIIKTKEGPALHAFPAKSIITRYLSSMGYDTEEESDTGEECADDAAEEGPDY